MATGAPGLEAPATHQLPCSRRAARRFAGTWGLAGRLLHRGIIGVDEALQRIQRSICDQAPVDPVLLDAQLRAADQVPSLYFHLKHNRDAGRFDSKARAATFHAKAFVPPAEIVLARHAHSVAAQRRHVMDGDAAAGWSGEALAALGGSLRGHAADSAAGWLQAPPARALPLFFDLDPDDSVYEACFCPDLQEDLLDCDELDAASFHSCQELAPLKVLGSVAASSCGIFADPYEAMFDGFDGFGGFDDYGQDEECLMSEPCDGQSAAWTGFELSDSDEDHGDGYLDRVRGVFGGFFDIPDRFILADRIFDFLSPRSAGRLQNSHLCFTYLALPLFFEEVCAGSCCSSSGSAGPRSPRLFAVVD